MAVKIVRNDITKMRTEAIVNTANTKPIASTGCDYAIYNAAGYEKLLSYRREYIGSVAYGEAFITPSFDLGIKNIIHTVSPLFVDGNSGEEELLRNCYKNSLRLAKENGIKSISFPLISTGNYRYPREEGIRIAMDEINSFLLTNEMDVYLVVFDRASTDVGSRLDADLKKYIDDNYAARTLEEEYLSNKEIHMPNLSANRVPLQEACEDACFKESSLRSSKESSFKKWIDGDRRRLGRDKHSDFGNVPMSCSISLPSEEMQSPEENVKFDIMKGSKDFESEEFLEKLSSELDLRMAHMTDSFSQYLLFLIGQKKLKNSDVYSRAVVDKKVFSKIKNNVDYHPQKITALCLCIGAMLNLDESKDLLARAGYALSPCDKTDLIFSYFIENGIYDIVELDIRLEEYGLPCIID